MTGQAAGLSGVRGVLTAATSALLDLPMSLGPCPPDELGQLMAELAALVRQAQAAQVSVLREATSRGVIAAADVASPAEWVLEHSGAGAQIRDATVVARVADGCALPRYAELDQPVRTGVIALPVADAVLREHGKLADYLSEDQLPQALTALVDVARSAGEPQAVGRLSRQMMGRSAAVGGLQRSQDRLHERRALSAFAEDHLGLLHARLVLDPASHALVCSVLDALAAPVSESSLDGPSTPDPRTADQRRADALVEACAAYAGRGSSARLGTRAKLVVTMAWTDLRDATGSATTQFGHVIAPETVRRLACDAGIVPLVLGSAGEVLDVGREHRVVTAAQLVALGQRDGGCTFPGCTRPLGWCQAHHIVHWANGGPTSLDNLALLCARHHTVVHRRGYRATVQATGVTWARRSASPWPAGVSPP